MGKRGYYGVNGIECPILYNPPAEDTIPVILLHGYNFTGETWREVGVLDALEKEGISYAAPDMPYGKRTSCTKKSRSLLLNLRAVEETVSLLGGSPPLIVGASLGGRIALYYAAGHEVKGLLLASPAVREDEEIWRLLKRIRVPVMIIRGSRDFIPLRLHESLARGLGARLVVYEDAGHVVYRDRPERFVEDLLNFYALIAGLA
ncbi:MAG: alpha/beta hydrolase [Desulfurococcales archaeon]|nr:alpha/beta hydrolase [Desulfurococcales archaeon]